MSLMDKEMVKHLPPYGKKYYLYITNKYGGDDNKLLKLWSDTQTFSQFCDWIDGKITTFEI